MKSSLQVLYIFPSDIHFNGLRNTRLAGFFLLFFLAVVIFGLFGINKYLKT